jgi:hypothetical protein
LPPPRFLLSLFISWIFVYRLYTTRIKRIITLLSLHVSALLGHHQVTKVHNCDIKVIPIQRIRCIQNIQHCEYTRRMYYHNIKV